MSATLTVEQDFKIRSSTIEQLQDLIEHIRQSKSVESALVARIKELEIKLQSLKKTKRYGLVWEDKQEDVVERCKQELPVLVCDDAKTIEKNADWAANLLIEGDNYHALSTLAYTHKAKVDVIYVDPPYNTGNTAWIYNNQYVDKEDAFKHSKFASFLYKRFRIARSLLKEDGLFICAIDDYEVHNVRHILDEVFWEENRLSTVCVVHNPGGRQDESFFATAHEYMLVYAKDRELADVWRLPISESKRSQYVHSDSTGGYKLRGYRRAGANSRRIDRPNLWYPIYYDPISWGLDVSKHEDWMELWPVDDDGVERVWRWGAQSFMQKKDQYIEVRQIRGKPSLQVKERELDNQGEKPKSLWNDPKYSSVNGTATIKEIFGGEKVFDYPKSPYLMEDVMRISTKRDSLVLDFFGWSGTTAHAVLSLNSLDGGSRRFIICTNNENSIAETITYQRIKSVIEGYSNFDGIPANLRYYKTDFINTEKSIDDLRKKFIHRCTGLLQIREDCFKEYNVSSWSPNYLTFENEGRILAVAYSPMELPRLSMLAEKESRPISAYIFSMGSEIFEEEFSKYKGVSIETIPDEILLTYRKIFGF